MRDILRNAANDEASPGAPLGTRLKTRFAGIGLEADIEELGRQLARPARLRS